MSWSEGRRSVKSSPRPGLPAPSHHVGAGWREQCRVGEGELCQPRARGRIVVEAWRGRGENAPREAGPTSRPPRRTLCRPAAPPVKMRRTCRPESQEEFPPWITTRPNRNWRWRAAAGRPGISRKSWGSASSWRSPSSPRRMSPPGSWRREPRQGQTRLRRPFCTRPSGYPRTSSSSRSQRSPSPAGRWAAIPPLRRGRPRSPGRWMRRARPTSTWLTSRAPGS